MKWKDIEPNRTQFNIQQLVKICIHKSSRTCLRSSTLCLAYGLVMTLENYSENLSNFRKNKKIFTFYGDWWVLTFVLLLFILSISIGAYDKEWMICVLSFYFKADICRRSTVTKDEVLNLRTKQCPARNGYRIAWSQHQRFYIHGLKLHNVINHSIF